MVSLVRSYLSVLLVSRVLHFTSETPPLPYQLFSDPIPGPYFLTVPGSYFRNVDSPVHNLLNRYTYKSYDFYYCIHRHLSDFRSTILRVIYSLYASSSHPLCFPPTPYTASGHRTRRLRDVKKCHPRCFQTFVVPLSPYRVDGGPRSTLLPSSLFFSFLRGELTRRFSTSFTSLLLNSDCPKTTTGRPSGLSNHVSKLLTLLSFELNLFPDISVVLSLVVPNRTLRPSECHRSTYPVRTHPVLPFTLDHPLIRIYDGEIPDRTLTTHNSLSLTCRKVFVITCGFAKRDYLWFRKMKTRLNKSKGIRTKEKRPTQD